MAIEINQKPMPFCPNDCKFMRLIFDEQFIFSNNDIDHMAYTAKCQNEDMCKMWVDKLSGK